MTCLRPTRPRDLASRRYYIHYLFIPGKETATTLEMFSSSRTVRLVVRESEEMEVRVMWKSDSNETRYNGRSAQGLKRKFGSASYMKIQGSTESGRHWEKRREILK